METKNRKNNKGEWSEVYAFAKLLKDGKIYSADEDANLMVDCFSDILEIYRDGKVFSPVGKVVIILENEQKIAEFPMEEIEKLLPEIKRTIETAQKSPFENVPAEKLLELLNEYSTFQQNIKKTKLTPITAKNNDKADIFMRISNMNVSHDAKLGFSIKSYLGGPPTLFNCSHASKFRFKFKNPSQDDISFLCNKDKTYSDVKEYIIEKNIKFDFDSLVDDVFKGNLMMVDSLLPKIMGEALKCYYLKKGISLVEICQELEENDFLQVGKNGFYQKKIVDFLVATALGMTAGKPWDGKEKANGGFLIVKKSGDIVCYHIYDRDTFREYLLKHVKMDTPDSKKYLNKGETIPDGRVYLEKDVYQMNLNLQIRFCNEGK